MNNKAKLALAVIVAVAASLATNAQQVMLTMQQALQLVKAQRTDSANLSADFYAAPTTNFVFDDISPVDTVNIPTWVLGGGLKNLIFVDEAPNAKWIHPCSYYYVSGTQLNPLIYKIEGLLPPSSLSLQPVDVKLDEANFSFIPTISPTHPLAPGEVQMETGTHVLLLVDVVNRRPYGKSNTQSWNECAALYNVLTKRYRVPKSNIRVLMGSIEYAENENGILQPSDTVMYDSQGNPVPLIRDMDGDGENDVMFGSSLYDYETLCDSLSGCYNDGEIEHLFFCYIGNAYTYPTMDDGEEAQTNTGICAGELNLAFRLKAQKQTFMFDCPFAFTFMHDISHRENVVLIGTQNEYDPDFLVSDYGEDLFFKYWINALAGYNVNYPAIEVESDLNLDGYVTLHEAFKYAKNNHPYSGARYESIPSKLIKELSFDLNNRTDLKVHQGDSYNSPDIWIRNDSDGLVNQTQERIYVSENNRIKYIYVRVHNDGRTTYREGNRHIYLYWQKPCMGMRFSLPENYIPDYGGFIDYITITDTLTSNSSRIVQYQWYVTDDLLTYAQANGGLLPLTLIAQVYDDDCGNILTPQDYAKTTKIVFNPEMGTLINENNGYLVSSYIKNNVPITFSQSVSNIAVSYHGANYNIFNQKDIGLKFSTNNPVSQMIYDSDYFSVDNSDSQKLRILSSGSQISDIPTTMTNFVELYSKSNRALQLSHPYYHNDFGLEFYDNQMNLIDGIDFICEIDSFNISNPNPGIGVHSMPCGTFTLEAQNVKEGDELNWYDNDLECLGHKKEIEILPGEAQGLIILQVCHDGDMSYASVDLTGLITISDAFFMQDGNIQVTLTSPVSDNYSILVTNALRPTVHELVQIAKGGTKADVSIPQGVNGPFIISLLNGDIVLDSRQIMK